VLFSFFNEVAIIGQLAGSLFERRLPAGFLVSHFAVLNHLARLGDGKTPLALARAFQVPKTTMTHTLAGLEKAGLIRFAPNPRDGRSKCAMLTEAGRVFRNEAIAASARTFGQSRETSRPTASPLSCRSWQKCGAGSTGKETPEIARSGDPGFFWREILSGVAIGGAIGPSPNGDARKQTAPSLRRLPSRHPQARCAPSARDFTKAST
jgi:DNA-binding MarR family transcriptional regulator